MCARTNQAPAHFNVSYALPKAPAPVGSEKVINTNISKTDKALEKAINQVTTQFEEAVGAFHQVGEFANGGGHAEQSAKA